MLRLCIVRAQKKAGSGAAGSVFVLPRLAPDFSAEEIGGTPLRHPSESANCMVKGRTFMPLTRS